MKKFLWITLLVICLIPTSTVFATTTYTRLPAGNTPQLPIHIIFTNDEGVDPCTGEDNSYVWELSSTENNYFSSQVCLPSETSCDFYFTEIPVGTTINHSTPFCGASNEGAEFEDTPFVIAENSSYINQNSQDIQAVATLMASSTFIVMKTVFTSTLFTLAIAGLCILLFIIAMVKRYTIPGSQRMYEEFYDNMLKKK